VAVCPLLRLLNRQPLVSVPGVLALGRCLHCFNLLPNYKIDALCEQPPRPRTGKGHQAVWRGGGRDTGCGWGRGRGGSKWNLGGGEGHRQHVPSVPSMSARCAWPCLCCRHRTSHPWRPAALCHYDRLPASARPLTIRGPQHRTV